jgi:hypothetical protein
MAISYAAGLGIVYCGFLFSLAECIWEPALLRRPYQIQLALLGIVFVLAGFFTINIALVSGPLEVNSFAMRNHNYPSGAEVEGITWHKNLTDLRVVISNQIDDNYKELDLTIHPDKWVYRGAIFRDNPGCILTPISANHVIYTTMTVGTVRSVTVTRGSVGGPLADIHDDAGDIWHPLASHDGYRLYCDRFPSKSNIQVIFALVSPDASPPPQARVEWGKEYMAVADYASEKCFKTTVLDCLKDRPNPSVVRVDGTYKRRLKTITFSRTLSIHNAD